jgi:hypothetical protein
VGVAKDIIIHFEKNTEDTKIMNATEQENFIKIINNISPVLRKKTDITQNFKLEQNDLRTVTKFGETKFSQLKEENVPIYAVSDIYVYPKEDVYIAEARENLIREQLKKEEEIRHKIQLENQLTLQNRLLDMKPKGPINGNKLTFDCYGNVILINGINTEKLPNDFLSSK